MIMTGPSSPTLSATVFISVISYLTPVPRASFPRSYSISIHTVRYLVYLTAKNRKKRCNLYDKIVDEYTV